MVENREKSEENVMEVDRKNLSHLHTVRFYNLPPRGITCMAYNATVKRLALSRTDASIEVWNVGGTPFMERVIFGAQNASIESLAWVNECLVSAGLSGEIVCWNLKSLEPQQSLLVTGTSIWCLDVYKNKVAAGTEEGYINICQMDDMLVYERAFDKQEGRILCCKFSPSGDFLATGSIDTVRVWNVENGHALHRMTLSRTEMRTEIVVWAIQYLPDDVIVSADSAGRIIFFDGKLGNQSESYQALKTNALCLAVNEDASKIFVSGTEPVIRTYTLTTMKKDSQMVKKWVKSVEKYLHTHDVKALSLAGNVIFSGGVDSHLMVSNLSPFSSTKFAPLLRSTSGEVTENRLLLLKYFNHLEIWQLGSVQEHSQDLQKLLELQSRDTEAIICSALAPSGEILIYSTDTLIKLFHFDSKVKPALLTPLKVTVAQFAPSLSVAFSQDSKMIFLVKNTGQVDVFTITSQMDLDHIQTIETHKYIKDLIHLVTPGGKFLALAGLCNSVVVWRFEEVAGRWKRHINLPKYINPPTAMRIHSISKRLVVVYLDGKLIEYDLEELQFTFSVHIQEGSLLRPIINLALDPRDPNLFILQDEETIFSIRKLQEIEEDTENSRDRDRKKVKKSKILDEKEKFAKKIIRETKHLALLTWLGNEEMVAVEISEDSILEQLPPPLKIKKYGTG